MRSARPYARRAILFSSLLTLQIAFPLFHLAASKRQNGVVAEDFVKAVSWCRANPIRDALVDIFQRTNDVDILLDALPAVEAERLILRRIRSFLAQIPQEEGGAYGDGYNLLVAASERIPKQAKELILHYQVGGSALRCYSVCQLLQRVHQDWSIELLSHFPRRMFEYNTAVHKLYNREVVGLAVLCDERAQTPGEGATGKRGKGAPAFESTFARGQDIG